MGKGRLICLCRQCPYAAPRADLPALPSAQVLPFDQSEPPFLKSHGEQPAASVTALPGWA